MKDHLESRKTKEPFEINWQIREFFSEAALDSFCDEIDEKYLYIEKKISLIQSSVRLEH